MKPAEVRPDGFIDGQGGSAEKTTNPPRRDPRDNVFWAGSHKKGDRRVTPGRALTTTLELLGTIAKDLRATDKSVRREVIGQIIKFSVSLLKLLKTIAKDRGATDESTIRKMPEEIAAYVSFLRDSPEKLLLCAALHSDIFRPTSIPHREVDAVLTEANKVILVLEDTLNRTETKESVDILAAAMLYGLRAMCFMKDTKRQEDLQKSDGLFEASRSTEGYRDKAAVRALHISVLKALAESDQHLEKNVEFFVRCECLCLYPPHHRELQWVLIPIMGALSRLRDSTHDKIGFDFLVARARIANRPGTETTEGKEPERELKSIDAVKRHMGPIIKSVADLVQPHTGEDVESIKDTIAAHVAMENGQTFEECGDEYFCLKKYADALRCYESAFLLYQPPVTLVNGTDSTNEIMQDDDRVKVESTIVNLLVKKIRLAREALNNGKSDPIPEA